MRAWSRVAFAGPLLALLLGPLPVPGVVLSVAAPDDVAVRLEDEIARQGELAPGATWTARLDVPPGGVAVAVLVLAEEPVVARLARGRPFEGAAAMEGMVEGTGRRLVLALSPLAPMPAAPGPWFLGVRSLEGGAVRFEVVAFVDGPGGPRTVLPGMPAVLALRDEGSEAGLRTWLPTGDVRAEVLPRSVEGGPLRWRLEGPGGVRRQGRGDGPIPVGAAVEGDAPGVWRLTLHDPSDARSRGRVTVTASWEFRDGVTLAGREDALLLPGEPLSLRLGGREHPEYRALRLAVPADAAGFVLEATNDWGSDVELYVRRGQPIASGDLEADWMAVNVGSSERLVVRGEAPLPPGPYHGEVALVDPVEQIEVVLTLSLLGGDDPERSWGTGEPEVVRPGHWVRGSVAQEDGAIRWHAVDVPQGASFLRAQVIDATVPLDLVVARRSDGAIFARAMTALANERIEVSFSRPLPSARRFYLGVLDRSSWEDAVHYRVAVALDASPPLPPDLRWPPWLRGVDLAPPERVAAATVEVTVEDCGGGSGVCVSPRGLVLSCRHCLERCGSPPGIQVESVLISFSTALDRPPVQAFYARVVAEDPLRDLVLLEPTTDVYGRPLPEALDLPWIPLRPEGESVRLGDPLLVAGYPEEGSEQPRTPVLLSRGIVAGLEWGGGGPRWIKTDAWIAPGHSGGPVVDARGRLVGIAAATLGHTSPIGLAIPLGAVPEEWRARIRRAQR